MATSAETNQPQVAVNGLAIGGLDFWNERGCDPIQEQHALHLVRQATGAAKVVDPMKT
ncbi:MAG: hypothetical protein ACO3B2_10390 [Vulcanococcus sp.]